MNHPNIKLLILALVLIGMVNCESPKEISSLSTEKSQIVDQLITDANIPGIQIAYFDNHGTTTYATGFKSLGDSSLLNAETTFLANDLGYSAIAAICFRLSEAGELRLDQAIFEDFQDARLVNESLAHLITYNHALSHTAGLPIWAEEEEAITIESVPGEIWNYSHTGYQLIQKALEIRFGTTIQSLAEKWVFEPLTMNASSFVAGIELNTATGHDLVGRNKVGDSQKFFTTASDQAKLLNALMGRSFLNADSQKQLQISLGKANAWGGDEINDLISWGPGFGIQSKDGKIALWQYSDDHISMSFSIIYPEQKKGLVLLTNSENGLSIGKEISNLFFDEQIWALDWLAYDSYKNPERKIRIELESAFANQNLNQAAQVYRNILEEQYDLLTDELISNIVWSFFSNNQLDEAESLVRLHLEQYPTSDGAHMRLGEILGFKSEYQKSWQSYQRAMELNPGLSSFIMPRFPWYIEATNVLQEEHSMPLTNFVGSFDKSKITLNNGALFFSDNIHSNIALKRIGNTLFDLETAETFRVVFLIKDEKVIGLERSFLDGNRTLENLVQ